MQRRRILWLWGVSLLFLGVLAIRLFVQMVLQNTSAGSRRWQDALPAKAELEHFELLQVDDGRGRILYRNGYPWSGQWKRLRAWHGMGPITVHTERVPASEVNPVIGVVGQPDRWPDAHRAIAEQGRSGLEYTFDHALSPERAGYVARLQSPGGRVQETKYFSIQPISGADVRTTIDPAWQHVAESALQATGVNQGAVVVLDTETDEALAVAGTDRGGKGGLTALTAETPGSVFKLVTAAAALDSSQFRPDSPFVCPGGIHIPGVDMNCWATHGNLSLVQAIAESCDTTFAQLGMRLGRTALSAEQQRLNLSDSQIQKVDGKPVLSEADGGIIFRHSGDDSGLLANTAIGQEDARLSPLQAANLVRTIANHGRMNDVRLVLDAERHGTRLRTYTGDTARQVMSGHTAYWLGVGMREAVISEKGTAHSLAQASVHAAVKTGTAELGRTGKVNGWVAGFAPYERPQIAFAIFVGDEYSDTAHRQTRDIALRLLQAYRQFHSGSDIG